MKPYFRLISAASRLSRCRTRAMFLQQINYMLTILFRGKWLSLVFMVIKRYILLFFFMIGLRTLLSGLVRVLLNKLLRAIHCTSVAWLIFFCKSRNDNCCCSASFSHGLWLYVTCQR